MKEKMEIRYKEAYKKIISILGWAENENDFIAEALRHDYLTINEGRDGQEYAWYYDGNSEVAIRISDHYQLTDVEIENQFL